MLRSRILMVTTTVITDSSLKCQSEKAVWQNPAVPSHLPYLSRPRSDDVIKEETRTPVTCTYCKCFTTTPCGTHCMPLPTCARGKTLVEQRERTLQSNWAGTSGLANACACLLDLAYLIEKLFEFEENMLVKGGLSTSKEYLEQKTHDVSINEW